MTDTANRVRALNDRARQSFQGCRVAITAGIAALGHDAVYEIFARIKTYDDFTPNNDPYNEHDFGSFQHKGMTIFWKFDYYDLDLSMHSLDASDASITARVLTVMLADEY